MKNSKRETKNLVGIIVMLVGILTLIAGLTFFLVKILTKPDVLDGDFLVSVGEWRLETDTNCADEANCEDNSGVIWNFTEIGKGTLTTNNHLNDYDFIWAIENGKLKIETSWLYNLNDEYEYKIDNNKLILNDEITFVPSSS